MTHMTWLLTDVDSDVYIDELTLSPKDVPVTTADFAVHRRTLRGGVREGVEVVEVRVGQVSFTVLPTRGMGIWRAQVGDVPLGWQSPVRGPVHPRHVPTTEPGGLGWLGGFDELLVRCGLQSNGGPVRDERGTLTYGLHGKVANIPAHFLAVSIDTQTGEVSVIGEVEESRLFHNKLRLRSTISARPGESVIRVVDQVTNLSAEPGELQLLYHVNFGAPLLEAGARVLAPVRDVIPVDARAAEDVETWNVYPAGRAGYTEQCYFLNLLSRDDGSTRVTLHNAAATAGVSLKFDRENLPCFTQWKNTQCHEDGYVTGLEPAINLPNPRPFEAANGRVTKLAPGEQRTYQLEIEGHDGAKSVAAAADDIESIQGGVTPTVHNTPVAGWSPSA
jgi:hypothetical protein